MDQKFAIERQRLALVTAVASLFAMIGLIEGSMVERIRRPLNKAVLALLRPAEWALRRLIVAAAQGLNVKPRAKRPAPPGGFAGLRKDKSKKGKGRQSFRLFDPRQRYDRFAYYEHRLAKIKRPQGPAPMPRIRYFDDAPLSPLYRQPERPVVVLYPQPAPVPPKPQPDGTISAMALCRRLEAIRRALADLPRQARRYANWKARPLAERRPKRETALRPGEPPYLSRKATHETHDLRRRKARHKDHEVYDILEECHWLAREALAPDTS